ncbi:GspH/FimT family pseudopilin [Amphritea sp. HPY]|uniref:GspH/FimT family pseudopilin n=1 Tax=Amphritea sp. HPY TaxID=3421652 RepID=UPI003D7C8C29
MGPILPEGMLMQIVGRDRKLLPKQQGFTVIELMIAVAIIGILVAIAAPNMSSYWREGRLVSATEAIYSQMQLARSIALAKNEDVDVRFPTTGTGWCMGVTENSTASCTCGSCSITGMPDKVLTSTDYPNTSVAVSSAISTFTMPRGVVTGAGNVVITLDSGEQSSINLSILGRVSICSSDLNQYKDC